MKKILLFAGVLCAIILFAGSLEKNKEVEFGSYYLVTNPESVISPYVSISEDQIVFTYDFMSSRLCLGTYTIKGDVLTMTSKDEETFVFQIKGECLVFKERASSELKYVSEKEKELFHIVDGSKFKLRESVK